ncbi:MAG: hypothetical protein ABI620_01445 [Chloroflexota bacterium]
MLPKAFSSLGGMLVATALLVAACGGATPTTSPVANATQGVAKTAVPTVAATAEPTAAPTAAPTAGPTLKPTVDGVQNGRIAYAVKSIAGNFNLYSSLPDGSGELQLTTGSGNSLCAAYSADGTKIAYCASDGGDLFEIWTMQADGTKQTQVTHLAGRVLFPDFSPDGKRIAFAGTVATDANTDIYVVDASTGKNLVALTSCKGKAAGCSNDYPAWSPDGKLIVFIHQDDYVNEVGVNEQVWVMDADGGNQRALTTGTAIKDQLPNWSPDGKSIVYVSRESDKADSEGIWVMAADGSGQVQLTGCKAGEPAPCAAGDDFAPVWSPDGTRIAFLRAFGAVGANDRPVYVMNADGTDQQRLLDASPILQTAPAWQALRM